MDPTTELFCSTVHCLGIFPNDFHGPRACSFSPPSLICYSFCSFAFCSFSLYFLPLFFNYCSHPVRALSLWPPMSQEKQGDATMWLCWQWHEWPRWQGHLSEDLDTGGGGGGRGGGGEGGEKMERMKRGGKDERRGAPVQPLFLFSLFSVVGKEFSVPWVVRERKVEWGEGRGGALNHGGQQANKRQNFNKSWISISTLALVM